MRDHFEPSENPSSLEKGKDRIWLEGILLYCNEQDLWVPLEKLIDLKVIYKLC